MGRHWGVSGSDPGGTQQVFAGRLRVMAKGELLELRLEDPSTGDLFALCPVPPDKKDAYVEQVTDSSRNFVIRVEDPASGRHAFLGMGFAERGEAFDFNVAMSDHVRHCQRDTAIMAAQQGGGGNGGSRSGSGGAAALSNADAAVLYQPQKDLSLKEGQTIHVSVKPGMSSSHAVGRKAGAGLAAAKLAPPLGGGLLPPPPGPGLLAPPPAAAAAPMPHQPAAAAQEWTAFSEPAPAPEAAGGWATFD